MNKAQKYDRLMAAIKKMAESKCIEDQLDALNGEADTEFVIEDAVETIEDAYDEGMLSGNVWFARQLVADFDK